MNSHTFSGGVHPHDYKELAKDRVIENMPIPTRVVIPVQQHIGAPAKVLVAKNDEVKTGQVIAEAGGFVSVPVHASITGKVTAIAKMPHPVMGRSMAIIIEGNGEDDWIDHEETVDPEKLNAGDLLKIIQEAGIAGMGGATFPTHVKLSPPKEKKIDVFLLNGAECEPFLTCDHRLMLEEGEKIVRGMRYMMTILKPQKAIIGIEDNKPDAVEMMKKLTGGMDDVTVLALPVKYPQGAEKQLIFAATGRTVPAGKLPMDAGCVVQNVGTAHAVADAVENGRPLIERVLTVSGNAVQKSGNFRVRIGTLFEDVVSFTGGVKTTPRKILMGGPMMGIAQPNLILPVIKGTSGILLFDAEMGDVRDEQPCINCGKCVDVCPMGLMPTTIAQYVEYAKYSKAEEFNAMDCIECGSCAYTCPSNRYLVQYIRRGKSQIVKNRRKAS